MRITGSTISRRYLHNLERNLSNKNDSENKVSSAKQYTRASQNPINAAKALKVRKSLSEIEGYQDNLNTAASIYEVAESSVMKISELIQSTYEKLIYGANGTQSDTEDIIIGETIKTYADEMLRLMNVAVADRNIFGGIANISMPYTMDGDNVLYHGTPVNDFQSPESFKYSGTSYTDIGIGMVTKEIPNPYDANKQLDPSEFYDPYSGQPYPLGGTRINPQSALPVTFNGAAILGCGVSGKKIEIDLKAIEEWQEYRLDIAISKDKANVNTATIKFYGGETEEETIDNINNAIYQAFHYQPTEVTKDGLFLNKQPGLSGLSIISTPQPADGDTAAIAPESTWAVAPVTSENTGYANNIIQLTIDAANILMSHDKLGAAQYADALFAVQTNLSLAIADIGNKEEFIEFNQSRLVNNTFSLKSIQNDMEATDLGEEITKWKSLEAIFNATLQMSASTLPMSIFNFM